MAEQTTVLQLVLNQLHLENSITKIDDRIALQKVVCLTQEAGLQLGYSFNWYVRGPYSPGLASDYYQLASARQTVEAQAQQFVLTDAALTAIGKVAAVISPPEGTGLTRVQWLELTASIVFLMKRHRLGVDAARQKVQLSKPGLSAFFDLAFGRLTQAGFFMG